MTRLIDADALIRDIEKCLWDWETVDGITATTVLKQTISDIRNEPTVDAVPIEWLIRERNKHRNDGFAWIFEAVMDEWRREEHD